MIKQKGVCDICTKEFELTNGCFAVFIREINGANLEPEPFLQITVTKLNQAGSDYQHVCGKACLYRMIDKFIDKKGVDNDQG